MQITHNEATVEISEDINVWQFLAARSIKHPKYIVFEMDGDVISQDKWETTKIHEDADVCTDYLAGGG